MLATTVLLSACATEVSSSDADQVSMSNGGLLRRRTTTTKAPTTTMRPTTTATPPTAPTTLPPAPPATVPATTTSTTTIPVPSSGSGGVGGHDPARCAALTSAGLSSNRFYDDNAVWNIPASCYRTAVDSARWSDNWFVYSNRSAALGNVAERGAMSIGLLEYGPAIYRADEATTTIRVFSSAYANNLWGVPEVPWNPSWVPSPGNDHEIVILDTATGREWSLWLVQKDNWSACITWENFFAGFRGGVDLCVGQAMIGRNTDGSISDFRTASGISQWPGRGLGAVTPMVLIPRLDEIEAGSIDHALNNEAYNTMFGGACTAAQMGTAAAGRSCGYAIAPASRFEGLLGPEGACGSAKMEATDAVRSTTVPQGTRFSLQLTDSEIDSWLTSRGYTGAKRRTARIFAVALRDYGWIVSDTTCWDSNMSAEGMANPAAAKRWAALGIAPSDGSTLLDGLIRQDRIRTLEPPTNAVVTNL